MNKLLLTLIIGILLVGTIFAGGLTLSNISLSSKAETTLKAELPISKGTINPTITDITCDKTICKSWISYPNLINTEWINAKSYISCVDNIIREDKEICTTEELPPKEVVEEEMGEFKEMFDVETDQAIDKEKAEGEFGDLLFSLVNYARFIDINPETALERTNKKFIKRFTFYCPWSNEFYVKKRII
jgi:NTP pyrophosphatase (non-canonical NTP hydrolase)